MTFPLTFPFVFGAPPPLPTPVLTPTNTVLPPMPPAPHVACYPMPAWDQPQLDPNLRRSVRSDPLGVSNVR